MKHQDPLNPLEGTEFASQLAQFSSVEELQNIAGKLDNSLEAELMLAQSINNTMAATLIGKEIRAAEDTVEFNGSDDVEVNFDLTSYSSEVTVEVHDESGKLVATLTDQNLGSGLHSIPWNGNDSSGNEVPVGKYTVSISSNSPGGTEIPIQPLAVGVVNGVRYVDGNPILQVDGRDIPFGMVLEILEGSSNSGQGSNLIQNLMGYVK